MKNPPYLSKIYSYIYVIQCRNRSVQRHPLQWRSKYPADAGSNPMCLLTGPLIPPAFDAVFDPSTLILYPLSLGLCIKFVFG